jgi:RNA polymerase primary sigma factor
MTAMIDDDELNPWPTWLTHRLLTRDEERELVRAWQVARAELGKPEAERDLDRIAAGEAARDELLRCNMRFVARQASRKRHALDFDDAASVALAGLSRALDTFDPDSGNALLTYAGWWIRQSIGRERANTVTPSGYRLPVHLSDRLGRLFHTINELSQALGGPPTQAQVAARLGCPEAEVARLLRLSQYAECLDRPVGESEDATLGELLPDERATQPDEVAAHGELRDAIEAVISELSPTQRRVIKMRFGLTPAGEHTLDEIGASVGLTRERIRQIEAQVLGKLRNDPRLAALASAWLAA